MILHCDLLSVKFISLIGNKKKETGKEEEGNMQKLSTKQVAELAGKSQRQIRNLCEAGKLPCYKEEISTGTRYLIYANTKEFQELCGEKSMSDIVHLGEICEEEEEIRQGSIRGIAEIIAELSVRNEVLAREAGKVELLTDNLVTSKGDVKFYQDKYFEINNELIQARKELEEARKEIASLREENKKLKEFKIFGIKIK
jgi:hypothetical protein